MALSQNQKLITNRAQTQQKLLTGVTIPYCRDHNQRIVSDWTINHCLICASNKIGTTMSLHKRVKAVSRFEEERGPRFRAYLSY